MLTTGQTARLLGITSQTVINWMESGVLPFQRVGRGRRYLTEADLVTFVRLRGLRPEQVDPRRWAMVLGAAERQPGREDSDPAIFLTDLPGACIHWSDGARRLLGWQSADLVGRPISLLRARVPGMDVDLGALASWTGDEVHVSLRIELCTRKGVWLAVDTTISWVFLSTGRPMGTAFVCETLPTP